MKNLILALVLLVSPLVSYAEYSDHSSGDRRFGRSHNNFWDKVEHRQDKQAQRIERGIDRGQLTRREVRELRREKKHVKRQVRRYQYRHLNRDKKRRITDHLDYVSHLIRDLKHNDRYVSTYRSTHRKYGHHNHRKYRYRNDRNIALNTGGSGGFYFRF